MTCLDELIQYSNDCISGEIVSGQKHIWACERFLNDLKRQNTADFPYYWNEEEAVKIVKWFGYLKHTKGTLAGQFIKLTPYQKFSLCQLYGWRRTKDNRKRFNHYFKEVARKNAKSQEEAGVILYEIATQSTKNGEIYEGYCAGVKRDQSLIIFQECINLLSGSPLKKKFKITKRQIEHRKTGSFLKALCKEDGRKGDGTNPAILVLDEYHQHQTTEFYALGMGSNTKESLLMIITTAGINLTYPCYTQEYKYCSEILNPNIDVVNDEYFVDILEIDQNDDISNPQNWLKANPIRMTYREGIEKISAEYEIAKNIPEKMTEFMTKCLNLWVQRQDDGYMDMEKWKACEVDKIPDIKGKTVYVGFDMSAKIDLTSVAFIIPTRDNGRVIYIVFSHSFIPNREKMAERIMRDKVPYDAWERLGYLTVTDTPIVDQGAVMNYVIDFRDKYKLKIDTLCFDPANASKLMLDLSNQGYDIEEVYQSHKSLNESTAGFREQVYCKNVMYLPNPLLNFAMSNAVIRTNNGLIKIDKDATKNKIDPVDAVLCAFKLALYHEFADYTSTEEWLDSEEW
ncbi:MAG: terminase large subunit [Clostridiales bacterium]|nr:terminase large subunit [Clostridiales bacterium]